MSRKQHPNLACRPKAVEALDIGRGQLSAAGGVDPGSLVGGWGVVRLQLTGGEHSKLGLVTGQKQALTISVFCNIAITVGLRSFMEEEQRIFVPNQYVMELNVLSMSHSCSSSAVCQGRVKRSFAKGKCPVNTHITGTRILPASITI